MLEVIITSIPNLLKILCQPWQGGRRGDFVLIFFHFPKIASIEGSVKNNEIFLKGTADIESEDSYKKKKKTS